MNAVERKIMNGLLTQHITLVSFDDDMRCCSVIENVILLSTLYVIDTNCNESNSFEL